MMYDITKIAYCQLVRPFFYVDFFYQFFLWFLYLLYNNIRCWLKWHSLSFSCTDVSLKSVYFSPVHLASSLPSVHVFPFAFFLALSLDITNAFHSTLTTAFLSALTTAFLSALTRLLSLLFTISNIMNKHQHTIIIIMDFDFREFQRF